MWTHLQPYLPNDRRAETVRRLARIGIWRAINLRRLIVLAGSGVTRPYGHFSWNDASAHFVALTIFEFLTKSTPGYGDQPGDLGFERTPQKQLHVLKPICELCDFETGGSAEEHWLAALATTFPTRSDLESHLKLIGENWEKRGRLAVARDLCEELLRFMDEGKSGSVHTHTVRRNFTEAFQPFKPAGSHRKILIGRDPISEILRTTKSRRILTTNYDVEFERWIFNAHLKDESQSKEHEAMKLLVANPVEEGEAEGDNTRKAHVSPQARRLSVTSPFRSPIVSGTIDVENVGDLVNFAAYSRAEEYQIFHLHGRYDRPEEMVVTKRDYRRVYARDPRSEEAFHAAQEVLFAGNDVLMLGFGGEDELLRPFRRFVQRGSDGNQAPRRTFALMPTDTSEDFKNANASQAIDRALDYDIYTLHYGGPRYRACINAIKSLRKLVNLGASLDHSTKLAALAALSSSRERRDDEESRFSRSSKRDLFGEELLKQVKARVMAVEVLGANAQQKARQSLKFTLDDLENTVRSRAMIYELDDLERLSRDWWDTWRHAPYERRARYHLAAESIAGEGGYLSVRHCSVRNPEVLKDFPEVWRERLLEFANEASKKAKQKAAERAKITGGEKALGRRIVRVSAPRGVGKSTLVNFLHRKTHHRMMFGGGNLNSKGHLGAFVAHLSFSMEFTSVLKAMTRFFAYWTAERLSCEIKEALRDEPLRELTGDEKEKRGFKKEGPSANLISSFNIQLLDALARIESANAGTGSLEEFERLRALLSTARWTHEKRLKAKVAGALRDPSAFRAANFSAEEIKSLAHAVVMAAWEDDQRVIGAGQLDPFASETSTRVERRHRLDVLRDAMADFSLVAGKERLFVCLSGLDRIANAKGDAFNPSHRAFFRLLTQKEEREKIPREEELDRLPVDIVLVAGRPEAPICYLSEEFGDEDGDFDKGDEFPKDGDVQLYSRSSDTKRILKCWPEVDCLDWDARIKLMGMELSDADKNYAQEKIESYSQNPFEEDIENEADPTNGLESDQLPAPQEALALFARWANSTQSDVAHRDLADLHESSEIHRLLWNNLALSLWVMNAWARQKEEYEKFGVLPVATGFHSFLRKLDGATARGGYNGVLKLVVEGYELVDRGACKNRNETSADLHALLLKHLTLFALPVEPWVLIGCPLIRAQLDKEFDKAHGHHGPNRASLYPLPSQDDAKSTEIREGHLALRDWYERAWRLNRLRIALTLLEERGVIMKIQPAADTSESDGPAEDFLHQRFSLHNLLKQYLSHQIRLAMHDGADINHHRMSVFCDQPKDLPSPTGAHFTMIEGIFEYQIDKCRETLASMYRTTRESAVVSAIMRGWDEEEPNGTEIGSDLRAMARRVYAPGAESDEKLKELRAKLDEFGKCIPDWAEPNGLAGGLGRLHAVPQRLRAMLSLIQGSFSIGSLSRLVDFTGRNQDAETPFDAYRSWLRSLLNAGASLDRSRREYTNVYYGTFFPDAELGESGSRWLSGGEVYELDKFEKERLVKVESEAGARAKEINFTKRQSTRYKTLRHPYYRDEIAWLYNERGLTALAQGLVYDALPLLRQAGFIMSHRRVPETDSHAFHAAERRVFLNYGVALIERGNLVDARRVLRDLHTGSLQLPNSTPSEILLFSELYLALCDHLSGAVQTADKSYRSLQAAFVKRGQYRTVAITSRFHADLLRARGNLEEAAEKASAAVKAAERSEQRDIEHLALVTQARVFVEQGKYAEAVAGIRRSLAYAQNMGLRATEIDAKIAFSLLMNAQGDHSLAGQYASEAAAQAVQGGLRLRKISALLSYAQSRNSRGSEGFARRLVSKAKREAEELGYMTAAAAATTMFPDA